MKLDLFSGAGTSATKREAESGAGNVDGVPEAEPANGGGSAESGEEGTGRESRCSTVSSSTEGKAFVGRRMSRRF